MKTSTPNIKSPGQYGNIWHILTILSLSIILTCIFLTVKASAGLPPLPPTSTITQYTILHNFLGNTSGQASADGAESTAALTFAAFSGRLYGTTQIGGMPPSGSQEGLGTIFSMNLDGSDYKVLHSFDYDPYDGYLANVVLAYNSLVVSGVYLYGTTPLGGTLQDSQSLGTIYKISLDGSNYTSMLTFTPSQIPNVIWGFEPVCTLAVMNNTLYGTTPFGGIGEDNGYGGTIFSMDLDSSEFQYLYIMTDAYQIYDGLTMGGSNILFGSYENTFNYGGSIFKINTDGSGLNVVTSNSGSIQTLLDNNGVLYVTSPSITGIGGSSIYKINSNGTGLANLGGSFSGSAVSGLIMVGTNLYGTAMANGSAGYGTVFQIDTNGIYYSEIHTFGTNQYDGTTPMASLTAVTNGTKIIVVTGPPRLGDPNPNATIRIITVTNATLYGTTYGGGISNAGVIFAMPVPNSTIYSTNSYDTSPVAVTGTTDGEVYNSATNITLTAGAQIFQNVGSVDFYLNGNLIGTVTSSPYSFNWTSVAPGTNVITVVVNDNNDIPIGSTNLTVYYNVNIITTVAGNNALHYQYCGDGGLATAAGLNGPSGLCLDSTNNLYIADTYNNVIRMVSASDGIITTVAGEGNLNSGYSGDFGPATNAQLNMPFAFSWSSTFFSYIVDTGNQVIRGIDFAGNEITTQIGNYSLGGTYSGDGGPVDGPWTWNSNVGLSYPCDLCRDGAGNVYIADGGNGVVRMVNSFGQSIITTVAGGGNYNNGGYSGDGGPAIDATMNWPQGVAVDITGNLYIADYCNNDVRKVDTNGIITTVAGQFSLQGSYSGDGSLAINAGLNCPCNVAVDQSGNLYISDCGNSVIRMVDTNGIITTVAGNANLNGTYSGDGGPATAAGLNGPQYVIVDPAGSLYISDYGNNVVRKVTVYHH